MGKIDRRNFIQQASIMPLGAMMMGKGYIENNDKPLLSKISDLNDQFDPWIEINLQNIKWNVEQIREITNNTPIMAVVKCNAYGHGTIGIGRFLESINIDGLAVIKLQEALDLREAGVKTPILNLGPFSEKEAIILVQKNIMPSIFNDSVYTLNEAAKKINKIAKVHLKIDTGMGRVGVPYYQADEFIKKVSKLSNIKIDGTFMTFTEDLEFDKVQLQRFLEVCDKARQNGISVGYRHAASSSDVLALPQSHLDMVRPGILIYGHYPNDKEFKLKRIEVKPALTLKTRVAQVKKIRAGDAISYHRSYIAEKQEMIATIPIGYYDGLPKSVLDKAEVLINGKKYKFIASVTADHSYVRFNDRDAIRTGDEIVIIGKQGEPSVSLEKMAEQMGNYSTYKILIGLNPLIPKVYL